MPKGGDLKNRKTLTGVTAVILVLLLFCAVYFALGEAKERRIRSEYPLVYTEYVELASEKYHISPEILYAVIRTESGFNPEAKSKAGACGLMQITPDTYDWLLYIRKETEHGDLFDPHTNIEYGAYFLAYLHRKFENWDTVFAAYNAGMNRVSEWLLDENISQNGRLVNIPFVETDNYVKKVNNAIEIYRNIYGM